MIKHLACIMDGNRRWAKRRGQKIFSGHRNGIKAVEIATDFCIEKKIPFLSLYTFSLENWRRPRWEVTALMQLLVGTLRKEIDDLMKKDVRLIVSGRIEDLPNDAARGMLEGIEKTAGNKGLVLNLALSYSSRQEILDAVREIALEVKEDKIKTDKIDEDYFATKLTTAEIGDPDLLIRTSGEFRISNFLLWQLAYTEIFVTKDLWPDFRKPHFYTALYNYMLRERRFGLVSEQLEQ